MIWEKGERREKRRKEKVNRLRWSVELEEVAKVEE